MKTQLNIKIITTTSVISLFLSFTSLFGQGNNKNTEAIISNTSNNNTFASGDLKNTPVEFNKAIKLDSKYAVDNNNYTNKNRVKKTLKDINKALELMPKYVNKYNHKGIVYYSLLNINNNNTKTSEVISITFLS